MNIVPSHSFPVSEVSTMAFAFLSLPQRISECSPGVLQCVVGVMFLRYANIRRNPVRRIDNCLFLLLEFNLGSVYGAGSEQVFFF